jgi:hypothetical protein
MASANGASAVTVVVTSSCRLFLNAHGRPGQWLAIVPWWWKICQRPGAVRRHWADDATLDALRYPFFVSELLASARLLAGAEGEPVPLAQRLLSRSLAASGPRTLSFPRISAISAAAAVLIASMRRRR